MVPDQELTCRNFHSKRIPPAASVLRLGRLRSSLPILECENVAIWCERINPKRNGSRHGGSPLWWTHIPHKHIQQLVIIPVH